MISIKAKPLQYPNFVILDIPKTMASDGASLDVGLAFPTDDLASEFWDQAKAGWMEHVRKRRTDSANPQASEKT